MKAQRALIETDVNNSRWASLDDPNLSFQYALATSVVTEFAAGHDVAAVMRELVQNEYDASGRRLEIEFDKGALTVVGGGTPIDERGWNRLSVMLGTGQVAGTNKHVDQKVNGIGSKNFGLRSLFLFGDRIYVASNGKQTVLDIRMGTPEQPQTDPASLGRRGLRIEVPYRTSKLDGLSPFTAESEKAALARLVEELTPTLIKLAEPGAAKSLREVVISSVRCQRKIQWTQHVRKEKVAQRGISVLRRSIRVADSADPDTLSATEIEFQRVLPIPKAFRGHAVPGYFQVQGGRIRISVSLPIARGRVLVNTAGRFYYPIGIGQGYSGCALSISAPFDMDSDRSSLLTPNTNEWNKWLLDAAVDLTMDLLVSDWLTRFGADAFLALRETTTCPTPYFIQEVARRLCDDAVWPSRARRGKRTNEPELVPASSLVLPQHPSLDGFFDDNRYLDNRLAGSAQAIDMVRRCGAKLFTANSLVHLRCTDNGSEKLATRLSSDEASYHYTEYAETILNVEWQEQCAKAFDHVKLSKQNGQDILASPSTLTAAGSLRPLDELWLVEPAMVGVCPLPPNLQVHPQLAAAKTFRRLIAKERHYDPNAWLKELGHKHGRVELTEEERHAAYTYLISPDRHAKQGILAKLREVPLLQDHRGAWVPPNAVTLPTVPGAKLLEPVLHLPHPDYLHDRELARALRFRTKLDGHDIVAFAEYVAENTQLAESFEQILARLSHLVTKPIATQLAVIAFLRSSRGGVASPRNLYIRTALIRNCLGDEGPYAAGSRSNLYARLGCMTRPRHEDIVVRLESLRQRGQHPESPATLYGELIASLRAEHLPTTRYADDPILWTGKEWVAPSQLVLTTRLRATLLDAVPQLDPPAALQSAFEALGAHPTPQPQHWLELFQWFDRQYQISARPLREKEQQALRNAYGQLATKHILPPPTVHCLLDSNGALHSLQEVESGRYVRNDDPQLAQACEAQRARVSFADINGRGSERVSLFLSGLNLRNLTDVAKKVDTRVGVEAPPPRWCKPPDLLSRVQSPLFASALCAAATHQFRSVIKSVSASARRLNAVRHIVFAHRVEETYLVNGTPVVVQRDVALDADQIVISGVHSRHELFRLLATVMADLFVNTPAAQREFADLITHLLLQQQSGSALTRYLSWRGIPWSPKGRARKRAGFLDGEDYSDELEDESQLIEESLATSIRDRLEAAHQTAKLPTPAMESAQAVPAVPEVTVSAERSAHSLPLPPLEKVTLRVEELSGKVHERKATSGSGGRLAIGSGRGHLMSEQRRQELGERGEQLVFDYEVRQAIARGQSPEEVRWVSRGDSYADHDIRLHDEKGQDIYIEVKSTADRHGAIEWSMAEFSRAVEAGKRYILVRVYEVDSDHPTMKRFRDPIGMLKRGELVLDVASLRVEVEPL